MPRVKPHSHPCAACGTKTECSGTWEENYDGFPEVICSEYHRLVNAGFISADDFVCEACEELGQCDECGRYRATVADEGGRICAECVAATSNAGAETK